MKIFLFTVFMFLIIPAKADGIFDREVRDLDLPCKVFDTDYYFGLGFGSTEPHANSFTSTASSGSLFFGKRLSPSLSVEADYVSLGGFYNSTLNQTTYFNVLSFVALEKYSFDEERYFSIYGRAGYAASFINIVPIGSTWHGDLTYGVGLEFTLSPAEKRLWYVRLGADRYNTGSLTPVAQNGFMSNDWVMNYSLSLLFNF